MLKDKVRVSKYLSFILRHQPEKVGLKLDRHGFANFGTLLEILKNRFPGIDENDVKHIVDTDPNGRFEMKKKMIRARYGHSVDVTPPGKYRKVPEVLYHGTPPQSAKVILREGLKPGERRFVHLSMSEDEAMRVGKRKAYYPVILAIDAKKAESDGLRFWREGRIYLTKEVPAKYIKVYR